MYKNIAGQRVRCLVINVLTNRAQPADAANILGKCKLDGNPSAPLGTPVPTDVDATSGLVEFALTQAETNGDHNSYWGFSTTPNVQVIPFTVYTLPIALSTLGTGYGARTILVTVNDGALPIESAIVRLTKGAESYYAVTNAVGQIQFNIDDGTWQVAISKSSAYTFPGATLVVAADAAPVYSMTPIALLPSVLPNSTTGQTTVYDADGNPQAGVYIFYSLMDIYKGDTGVTYDTNQRMAVSDVNGVVQFPDLAKGAKYGFQPSRHPYPTSTAPPQEVEIPISAGANYVLPSMMY